MGKITKRSLKKDFRIFFAGGVPTAVFLGLFVPLLMRDNASSYHLFFIILIGVPVFIFFIILQDKKLGDYALFFIGILGYILAFYNLITY